MVARNGVPTARDLTGLQRQLLQGAEKSIPLAGRCAWTYTIAILVKAIQTVSFVVARTQTGKGSGAFISPLKMASGIEQKCWGLVRWLMCSHTCMNVLKYVNKDKY